MSDPAKSPSLFSDAIRAELAAIVEEAVGKAMRNGNAHSPLLTAEELAEVLKVNKATIYDWVKTNSIPYYQAGRFVRFNLDEVLKAQKKPA